MVASKDCCSACINAFHGKQKFIRCSGPCAPTFHLSCLKMTNTEYSFSLAEGECTYRCVSCVVASRATRDENIPIRNLRSASTSKLPMKVVSPERELILPNLKDPESLSISVQLETVRLNGASTHNLVENVVQMVLKLPNNCGKTTNISNIIQIELLPVDLLRRCILGNHSPRCQVP
jgi:hypothetical protein